MVYNIRMKKTKYIKKTDKIIAVTLLIIILCAMLCIAGCDEAEQTSNFYVTVSDVNGYKVYEPEKDKGWVFIFYLGTAMSTSNYDAILKQVASFGIKVVVPDNKFADLGYTTEEKAFELFKADNYIIGGHSQGGGAAIRRASENLDTTRACVLFSAMISNDATLEDTELPVLLFEAQNDHILFDSDKSKVKERMNDKCEYVMLEGANHMAYGKSDLMSFADGELERSKEEIQDEVAMRTIAFIDSVMESQA